VVTCYLFPIETPRGTALKSAFDLAEKYLDDAQLGTTKFGSARADPTDGRIVAVLICSHVLEAEIWLSPVELLDEVDNIARDSTAKVGLPIPAAAQMITSTIILYYYLGGEGSLSRHLTLLLVIYGLAALIVSNIPFFSLKNNDIKSVIRFGCWFSDLF